jgi:hypothetical protein
MSGKLEHIGKREVWRHWRDNAPSLRMLGMEDEAVIEMTVVS